APGGAGGENPRYPLPRNPLDADAAVGGSSSGSAVAVAAGLCYGSLGTDTAGSVSIPAATCGVVGLMPTRGLLPGDGVAPLAGELDTVG
ncbi:amidase family protein, partial [Bordetella pertussis]